MICQFHLLLVSISLHFMITQSQQLADSYRVESYIGLEVCAVDQPTAVTSTSKHSMIQCAADCNRQSCCLMYQMNVQLQQCQLYNYLPLNLSTISGCKAFYRKLISSVIYVVTVRAGLSQRGPHSNDHWGQCTMKK